MTRIATIALASSLGGFACLGVASAEHMPEGPQGKMIWGWLETIVLKPWDVELAAKLDTGANTASIDADEIVVFDRKGEQWVRFTLLANRQSSAPQHRIEIERPLLRTVAIREHFIEAQARPVVSLQFCLDGMLFDTEFNLVDRTNFNYPVLLGRRFLQKIALVDAEATALTHTDLGACEGVEAVITETDEEAGDPPHDDGEQSCDPACADGQKGPPGKTASID